jgi:hypothetical protein
MTITSPIIRTALAFALAWILLAVLFNPAHAHHDWRWVTASAYGSPSRWDPTDYYGSTNSWWAWCAVKDADGQWPTNDWAYLRSTSRGIAHQTLPLGAYVEMRVWDADGEVRYLTAPITDRGPFAPWGDAGGPDIQEPVVMRLGYATASDWGIRSIQMRYRPDLGRYCPRFEIRLPDAVGQLLEDEADGGLESLEEGWPHALGWP